MLDPIFDLITSVLAWFYQVWPSYGMSIVFLTFLVMIIMTPLTMKSTRTMMQMQLLAPELKKIQKKYRHDRTELGKAQMEFYKEHNLNPMSGCLPILVQAPIFLVLYRVVMGLTRRATQLGFQLGHTSAQFNNIENTPGEELSYQVFEQEGLRFDPDFLSESTGLYKALSDETEMVSWGIDLSRSASTAMSEGIVEVIPYLAMIAIVLAAGLYQQHQIQRRHTNATVNPMQQKIMKLMPYTVPIISYNIPAAVVVYFIISSLGRIGQQYYIGRSLYSGEESLGAQLNRQRSSSNKKGSSKSGTGGKKLELKTSKKKHHAHKPNKRQRGHVKKAKVPVRPSRSSAIRKHRASGSLGRSGKAPSRTSRSPSQSGRVTPTGSKAKHAPSNRSKKKRKRH